MIPGLFDHLLALCLAVVVPVLGARSRKGMEELITERGAAGRRAVYLRAVASQWSLAGAMILLWVLSARSWAPIGIARPSGWGFAVALAVSVGVLGYLVWQLILVRRRPDVAAKTREAAAPMAFFFPSTASELRFFAFLCVTAGVVEELLFRGFLLWYLSAAVPVWAAVIVSSLAFGIGHLYQGKAAGLQTAVGALIMAGLYLLGGSLWVPMLLHGGWNYLQVRLVYDASHNAPAVVQASATPGARPVQSAPTVPDRLPMEGAPTSTV